ncbi:MAG: hypothetical protein GXP16_00520 [Gammaproteobacteria bacterium]|nr:hypothetical protein [Gammaproteobacteria bacterium]
MKHPHENAFDRFLDELEEQRLPAPTYLRQRILTNLPAHGALNDWFGVFTWLQNSLWRGAVAMLIPVAIGFSVGTYIPQESQNYSVETLLYADNLEEFGDHEI